MGSASAQTSDERGRQYVADFVRRERLVAENRLLAQEAVYWQGLVQPSAGARGLLDALTRSDDATRQAVLQAVRGGTQPIEADLDRAANGLRDENRRLAIAWQEVRTSLDRSSSLLAEVQASRQVAGQLAALLSFDKRWFWFFGVVAVGSLLALVIHDRRHEIRRLLYGGRGRALGLWKFLSVALLVLVVFTAVTFLFGDRVYYWLLPRSTVVDQQPIAAAAAASDSLRAEIGQLEQVRDKLRAAAHLARETCRQRWTAPAPLAVLDLSDQFRRRVTDVASEVQLLRALPEVLAADLARLEQINGQLEDDAQAARRYIRLKHGIRGLLGLGLLGLTLGGGWVFWRGVHARHKAMAKTCPLCLGQGFLRPEGDGAPQSGPHGAAPGLHMVKCHSVVSQHPHEECDYRFASAYQSVAKLCFPTLGVPQAGKTHWLAMIYWALNRGLFPRQVEFEKVKCQTSDDFDLIVEEILGSRLGTAATQRQRIPHPLVFSFRDRDRWSRSNLLVNIFDYSGEVTSDMGIDDYRRRRALEADGYFFFLDPTYPSEPQARALVNFREDLRLVKGAKTGQRVRTPVALCVSKVDLLASQPYALPGGGDAVARFYEDLARLDPSGESTSVDVIRARSELVRRMRETIWPGWEIERQVEELFGGRHLFFPLTPVGLDGRGETDLSLRTIAPFGLLEPLLWLLQMNGYPVLK